MDSKQTEFSSICRLDQGNRSIPRLPLEGNIDLTYRCNLECRHCWLRIPADSGASAKELTIDEIMRIVDEARKLGCRAWSISGGEPMLRPDFPEIFEYIIFRSAFYTLNSNGTLITPRIAQLMKQKGHKMISFYGADAATHDRITRRPGSFEDTLRGIRYLREAKAGFTVQLVLMRDNMYQRAEMIEFARSLSPSWRFGADWLYPAASHDPQQNREIFEQRIPARTLVALNPEDFALEHPTPDASEKALSLKGTESGYLFNSCILAKKDFYIDPYGKLTFCCFIKDPELMFDLRQGSFREGWDTFLPSLAHKIPKDTEYQENCGSCAIDRDCRCCPAFAYLENGRYSAKVDYLCELASASCQAKQDWIANHRRNYQIAGITMQVESDLPMTGSTFHPKFKLFEAAAQGQDIIRIHHYFSLPRPDEMKLDTKPFIRAPWAIYETDQSWLYLCIGSKADLSDYNQVAVFDKNFTQARIFHHASKKEYFLSGNLESLTMLTSDQMLLALALADRHGCYFHSTGLVFEGKGLLFVGHSGAGKSTVTTLLRKHVDILCDDRIIVKKQQDFFQIHGTWSHGLIPDVSSGSAPLQAIFILKKAEHNGVARITNKRDIIRALLSFVIKPAVSTDWWGKTLALVEDIVGKVPCYYFYFQKDTPILDLVRSALNDEEHGG
ncbi:MAG: radical SAM protein [Candidatus Aminicenantes bacterium]|nr:radical SAM protein [Candidatus Aminicenantes bacterium]